MNRTLLPLLLTGFLTSCAGQPTPLPPQPSRPEATRQLVGPVDSLLSRMTLEEKVGQMTQVTLSVIAAEGTPQRDSVRLDPRKLREAVVTHHVGSILNNVSGALSLEGWHDAITRIQDVATRETRLGIPVLYGIDAVHGVNYTRGATIFPHNLGLAATFDTVHARRSGEITADEVLASALPWNFAPVLDVRRQPLWPRFYETFGEEPLVAARMGSAHIQAMQRSGRVAATMKHYLGYSAPQSGRDRTPTALTERALREHFLPPFRAAVQAGAMTIMVNSREIDGVPVHASRYWLTNVLREELGFQGVVATDLEDIIYLHTRHRVAPTMKQAVQMAVEAAIDMSMTPNDFEFAPLLAELVREGTIPESRIDESVRRILTLKADLGLLRSPYPDPSLRSRFATPEAKQAALHSARESITLLKNDWGILPLRRNARIVVTGPAANSLTALNGGWTYTWQGQDAAQLPADAQTVLQAIRARASNVRYVQGSGWEQARDSDINAAVRVAASADVVVLALGENAYAETPGDIRDLTLPEAQLRLAEAVQATGTPTILLLVEGRPRIINRIVDRARGVVMAYWPGMEGGQAVAEMLFGEINPSGRLPFTYPRHTNALIPYDHKTTEALRTEHGKGPSAFNPQWEFGHGLSYTTFAYSDLRIARPSVRAGDPVGIQVTVRNTGQRPGKEAVLLFTRQHYTAITPAVRRLRAWDKVDLAPGEARTVTFTLSPEDLSYVGLDGKMVLEPGAFDVMVGGLTGTFQVTGC